MTEKEDLPGDAYLEKIVQVPINLPVPDRIPLRDLLFESLTPMLQDTPHELFDQAYWRSVYLGGIGHFITTPRDVVRLVNAFRVTYSQVKGEVNVVDFFGLETVRVFHPPVYDIIRRNREQFECVADSLQAADANTENLRRFHDEWLAELPREAREQLKQLLALLYPKLRAIWGNTYGIDMG